MAVMCTSCDDSQQCLDFMYYLLRNNFWNHRISHSGMGKAEVMNAFCQELRKNTYYSFPLSLFTQSSEQQHRQTSPRATPGYSHLLQKHQGTGVSGIFWDGSLVVVKRTPCSYTKGRPQPCLYIPLDITGKWNPLIQKTEKEAPQFRGWHANAFGTKNTFATLPHTINARVHLVKFLSRSQKGKVWLNFQLHLLCCCVLNVC